MKDMGVFGILWTLRYFAFILYSHVCVEIFLVWHDYTPYPTPPLPAPRKAWEGVYIRETEGIIIVAPYCAWYGSDKGRGMVFSFFCFFFFFIVLGFGERRRGKGNNMAMERKGRGISSSGYFYFIFILFLFGLFS